MFRPIDGGGASAWLSPGEVALLRTLVVPVMDLLTDPARPRKDQAAGDQPGAAAQAGPAEQPAAGADADDAAEADELFDDLEKMFSEATAEPPKAPVDPVLARLLPDAYSDDPEAAGEFRKYTESSLREAKKYFAQTLLETLPPKGGRVKLSADQAQDWLRALNDVRLMVAVRLDVSEDFEEQLAGLDPQDPRIGGFEAYGWLGAIQESLVRAIWT